jgi:hypothetical protein
MGSLEAALMQWQTTLGLPCSVNPSVVQGSEAPVLTRKLARRISSATPGANMQITDVQIYLRVQGTLRGYADVTFDDCLSIREIRLLRTATGLQSKAAPEWSATALKPLLDYPFRRVTVGGEPAWR